MEHVFCPGYGQEPFRTLAADYPGEDVYPPGDFRTEWGPIFHRGRLDGTARVLVLGQDPATHETITRRILVGEAGQRVQGLLTKIGITHSYVMINTFLFSVYGQGGGSRHRNDVAIAGYRNAWLDAILESTTITAVITLGELARVAWDQWARTQPTRAAGLHVASLRHPTYPESSSRTGNQTLAAATAKLLADWNDHLPNLRDQVVADVATSLTAYGSTWGDADLVSIPEADLPAGSPTWWPTLLAWAQRTGGDPQTKRATITVTVPPSLRGWPQPA